MLYFLVFIFPTFFYIDAGLSSSKQSCRCHSLRRMELKHPGSGPDMLQAEFEDQNKSLMQLFGWVQNKLNGVQSNKKTNPVPATHHTKREPPREEFNDWPHGLLAIGTFGNHGIKQNNEITEKAEMKKNQTQNSTSLSEDELADFTPEEVGELQKELKKLLKKKPTSKVERENSDLPLDRFLNCLSSLEISRRRATTVCSKIVESEDEIDRTIRVIIDRCKDVCMKKGKKNIGKKSISFLFKKFVCSSGFAPGPSLRDTFQETRMEKLLRSIISKKIYPQNTSRASSVMKYLEDGENRNTKKEEDQAQDKANEVSKWVKTDSDFIVLEI